MKDLDWDNIGFSYVKTDYRYIAYYKDGKWSKGELKTDNTITISEGSTALHYGQQSFEGLKAYRTKDGSINLFRPDQNALRMQASCDRLLMPQVSVEMFVDACAQVVRANQDWVGPYGSGATLYLRPYIIGVGDNIGVKPAKEYIFSVFCMPVGAYFKGGLQPNDFITTDEDRAAPYGTGAVKVGGNYAASLHSGKEAKKLNCADCIYLDPKTHSKIEEVGSANFFAITQDNVFVTPKSPSILPSITKYSLLELARDRLGLEVLEGDVFIDELDKYKEAGACGTAAIITPIGGIYHKGKKHVFYSETEVGEVTKALYDELVGIQFGDKPAPEGWIVKVDL